MRGIGRNVTINSSYIFTMPHIKMGYIAENPRKLENAFRFLPFFYCTVLN